MARQQTFKKEQRLVRQAMQKLNVHNAETMQKLQKKIDRKKKHGGLRYRDACPLVFFDL